MYQMSPFFKNNLDLQYNSQIDFLTSRFLMDDQNQQQQLPEQLIEMATNLSMQLAIPLLESPLNLDFVTECINTILSGLNPRWKPIQFNPTNQQQIDQAWHQIFKIVQSALLMDGQHMIQDNDQIGIQNIISLYQVLCQGCEALRQENLQPKNKQSHEKAIEKKEDKNNKKQSNKTMNNKKTKKNPQSSFQQHQKSKQKSPPKKNQQKKRPKTAMKKPQIESKKLQQQIIQTVTKTMKKQYERKAQPQRQARIREKQGTQAALKAQRTLDYAIKDYKIQNRLNQMKKQKSASNVKKDLVDHAYFKMIQTKHKKLNQQLQDQQLKYYLQLRDKKVAHIRHIHKLIEKLQRQREAQKNKLQREVQINKKKQLVGKIEAVDNIFDQNMKKLNQNYQNRRKIQDLQYVGQMEVCRAMQKNIKEKKKKQMQDLKNLWNIQRKQLHKITCDQQKMKQKLIQIYRKHRV